VNSATPSWHQGIYQPSITAAGGALLWRRRSSGGVWHGVSALLALLYAPRDAFWWQPNLSHCSSALADLNGLLANSALPHTTRAFLASRSSHLSGRESEKTTRRPNDIDSPHLLKPSSALAGGRLRFKRVAYSSHGIVLTARTRSVAA